jgi:hypothetical protein
MSCTKFEIIQISPKIDKNHICVIPMRKLVSNYVRPSGIYPSMKCGHTVQHFNYNQNIPWSTAVP